MKLFLRLPCRGMKYEGLIAELFPYTHGIVLFIPVSKLAFNH